MKKTNVLLALVVFMFAIGAAVAQNSYDLAEDQIASHYPVSGDCENCDEAGADNCTTNSASEIRCTCRVGTNSATLSVNSLCQPLFEPVAER